MTTIADFELGYDIISESLSIHSDQFHEFCESIKEVYRIDDSEMYLEKVVDRNKNIVQGLGKAFSNTGNTTRNVVGAVSNTMDAEASVFKAGWDIIVRAIALASRIIRFISSKIADIPRLIGFLWRKIARIPKNIKNKINGDLNLYISAAEIEQLYNTNLFSRIDQYVSMAEELAKGDMWGTMLHKRSGEHILKENDMKICRKMSGIYEQLKKVEFHQSTIHMKAEGTIDIYFGDSKSIKFKDLSRKTYECTYYEALSKLVEDMKIEQQKLEIVDKSLGAKYDRTKANQAFGRLNLSQQRIIVEMLQQTSKIVGIIGNLMKCIMSDLKTIEDAVATISKYQKIKSDKKSVKAAEDENEKVTKEAKKAGKKKK